jgi:hypothetical protein
VTNVANDPHEGSLLMLSWQQHKARDKEIIFIPNWFKSNIYPFRSQANDWFSKRMCIELDPESRFLSDDVNFEL